MKLSQELEKLRFSYEHRVTSTDTQVLQVGYMGKQVYKITYEIVKQNEVEHEISVDVVQSLHTILNRGHFRMLQTRERKSYEFLL
jgi:hypothetical protein